jgi:prepilin-type N-terminal cleavage/methylation domain-containing protein
MRKKGFTLVEIMIVVVAVSLLSGVIYKLMTGTFSQFFKSQTKLTNLRSASIILEHLKTDLRSAVVPANDSEKPEIVTNPGAASIKFHILSENTRKRVKYTFENSMVYRQLEGKSKRPVSQAKVDDFIIEKSTEPDNEYLAFRIIVDKDKELEGRNQSSKGNKVEVKAHLYPRFAASTLSDEERYWNLARQAAGGPTP